MLTDTINEDYKAALKNRDTTRSGTLSFLRAQLKNVMIDQKKEQLDDSDVIAVIKKQVKQRQDSIAQYEQGGRADLAMKEKEELDLLKGYLPEEISDTELAAFVEDAIRETGATGIKEMGAVMKAVLTRTQGCADNKKVSEIVRAKLMSS